MDNSKGVLNHDEIAALMDSGVIEFADRANINGASLNVRLGNIFLVESPDPQGYGGQHYTPLSFAKRESPHFFTLDGGVTLEPGGFCLASLVEKINLPNDLACDVMLRSSAARMGIQHLLAGWGDPKYSGHLTLELKNELKYHQIRLVGGDAIIQLRFHRLNPVADEKGYDATGGKYSGDTGPQPVKKEHAK